MINNDLRISGLASGMDTESIVKKLMDVERIPLNKLYQQKQYTEWKRDAYREINSALLDLQKMAWDMSLQSSYLKKTVSSSSEYVATASATSGTQAGTYSLKVNSLASNAMMTSSDAFAAAYVDTGDPSKGYKKASDIKLATGADKTIDINGKTITITDQETLDSVLSEINSFTSETGVKATYDSNTGRIFLTQTGLGSDKAITLTGADVKWFQDTFNFSYNARVGWLNDEVVLRTGEDKTFTLIDEGGAEITIDLIVDSDGLTIGEITDQLNMKLASSNITATYDFNTGRFEFTKNGTKTKVTIKNDPDTDHDWARMNLGIGAGDSIAGQDAKVVFNGENFTFSSNTFNINGLNITLRAPQAPDHPPIALTVNNDINGVFDSIVSFINKYNDTIDLINNRLSEKRYRDYKPLLDEQKKEMSEVQIELWEAKAKSGILQGDHVLMGVVAQLRNFMSNPVTAYGIAQDMDSIFDLGFKTGSYEEKGKIIIDENKLKEALSNNLDKVIDLFTKSHDTDANQRGIARRIYDGLKGAIKQITEKAGSNSGFSKADNSILGKELTRIDDRMKEMEDRLARIEERYWRQFNAMEQAIQASNNQALWLMQQFGGGA